MSAAPTLPAVASASPPAGAAPLSALGLFRLLLWVHWRTVRARVHATGREAPLLFLVLAAFILGYLGVGYWMFRAGLGYLYHFPLVGALLSQRILYLIFGFFFVMLVFSNLIIGYSTLFKNRETTWLLSLPLPPRNIYRWKFLEALMVSSWALVFLSAPMMAGYARVHEAPWAFYGQIACAFLPFVVLPALAGSWLVLALVRLLARRWAKPVILLLAAGALFALIFWVKPVTDADAMAQQDVLSFDQLLRHTRVSVNPFLPSAWMAQSVLAWGDGLTRQGWFFFLLLLSNALMGLLVGFEVAGRLFFGSWTRALSSRAERFQRAAAAKRERGRRASLLEAAVSLLRRRSPPAAALVVKDVRLFWREPSQWMQFVIFFGLLCIYVLNLRNVAFDFQSPFWETMISYLNLGASALTLSTLTTRFVYPQFSLEGRRLWILRLAPFGLEKVLLQKFWMSCLTACGITTTLMAVSSLLLHLPGKRVAFFAGAIAAMSAALSGLAVGLGALFPNMKEENPSKIVSGFGGTLCLVVSFIYIACFVGLAAAPDLRRVVKLPAVLPDWLPLSLAGALSLLVLLVPMAAAFRRVKNLEI